MNHAPWWMLHVGIGQFVFYAVPFLLIGDHLFGVPDSAALLRVSGFQSSKIRRAYLILLIVTLVVAAVIVGRVLWHVILAPPGWDYQALWLYGHVADAGRNPYLPEAYHALAGPGPFVQDFQQEVLDVGAVYPPPTLLLFGAIGWLPLKVAIVPWMILHTAAFAGLVMLLRRCFFPGGRWDRLALALTLSLLLLSTIATFGHGQVNFLAVLLVLAAWKARDRAVGGVYLVGAAILKLLYSALWLYPVLRAKLRPLVGIALAGAGAMLASLIAFGGGTFKTYLIDNPVTHRMPSYYFQTAVNQSLLGASLRLVPYAMPHFGPPMHDPLYLFSALIVGLTTVAAVIWQPRNRQGDDVAFILLILAGMLIYPWTLSNYFVLLLVPIGFLWSRRIKRPLGTVWTIVLISAVYPTTYFSSGLYSVVATLYLWTAVMVIAVGQMSWKSHKVQLSGTSRTVAS